MPTTIFHESQSEVADVNSRTCKVSLWGCKWVYGHSLRISYYPSYTEGASFPKIPTSLCCYVRDWPGASFQPFHDSVSPPITQWWRSGSSIHAQDPNIKVTWFPGVLSIKFPLKSGITTRFSTSENEDMYTLRWLGTDLDARLKIWPANFTFQQTASYL